MACGRSGCSGQIKQMKITKILIPIFNDWKSVFKLLENIDLQLDGWDTDISVIIINDASTEKKPDNNAVCRVSRGPQKVI